MPVVAGALLNRMFPRQVARAAAFTPLLAVAMTVAICASIIAASAGSIQSVGLPLLLAVTALHTGEPACTRSHPAAEADQAPCPWNSLRGEMVGVNGEVGYALTIIASGQDAPGGKLGPAWPRRWPQLIHQKI